MSPRAKKELAREHLTTASDDLSGGRQKDAINALFYAAEAAVVALAGTHGIDTRRRHYLKADAAGELYGLGVLKHDFGPLLRQLNQARKDVWYEVMNRSSTGASRTYSPTSRRWWPRRRLGDEPASSHAAPGTGGRVRLG